MLLSPVYDNKLNQSTNEYIVNNEHYKLPSRKINHSRAYLLLCCLYLHQDVERAGAGAVRAADEIVEVDAVSVVLLHDRQLKPGLFSNIMLRDVNVHVGTWMQGWKQSAVTAV